MIYDYYDTATPSGITIEADSVVDAVQQLLGDTRHIKMITYERLRRELERLCDEENELTASDVWRVVEASSECMILEKRSDGACAWDLDTTALRLIDDLVEDNLIEESGQSINDYPELAQLKGRILQLILNYLPETPKQYQQTDTTL